MIQLKLADKCTNYYSTILQKQRYIEGDILKMLKFDFLTIEDKRWMEPILKECGYMESESSFGTLYIWGEINNQKVCRYKNTIFFRIEENEALVYNFPVGTDALEDSLKAIIEDAREKKLALKFWNITKEEIDKLEQVMAGRFEYTCLRNEADYIYYSQDLINLSGRKYHSKRNHLSNFKLNYKYTYESITPENISDCIEIAKKWRQEKGEDESGYLYKEDFALNKAFEKFEQLDFKGGIIKIEGKPVAFTVGEEINDQTYLIHFEKALNGYDGLYAAINNEFATVQLSKYKYINREEDMGIEGLRKAKLSYKPAILLEKYIAVLKDEAVK